MADNHIRKAFHVKNIYPVVSYCLLLLVLLFLAAESLGRGTDSAVGGATATYDTLVNSGFDAIVHLDVKLGKLVTFNGTLL